ncbi:MAG: dihydroorotase [Furfurilactobacillus sp.]|jgi:dihydroorotase|uniref:Dihydroorotase n=2 Tax=Furfurilactobacillus TaxID=2767882 RepID=A0ABT6D9Y8_9LACO|nr:MULTISPECIES: dihydroorotase [Furfurilactobacillus]QLE65452.1 Dihydroorotase [Furfurilactobacillus rossiae]MCF6160950.1 dihydroorotase [Furfurilactobacillus milii]MCF6163284.1 dihydroorotase [Furfurilactobacillus milii]MCH4011959.1 dihydroorotase [Furfurilactobacillus sp.]MCH4037851.1 dihydroorotase [Furfurilactobacillus sp.]
MRLLIKGATIIDETGAEARRNILVQDGKVKAITDHDLDANDDERVIDAQGALLMPGLIDVHVHFREPGFEDKETIATGSRAAARGGFTTVLAMPNLNPVPVTATLLRQQLRRNEESGLIHVKQYGAISANLTDETVSPIKELAAAGAIGFTNDGKGVQSAATMLAAMKAAKAVNRSLVAHLEDQSLMNGGVMNKGERADQLGLPGADPLAETSQLARDLVLAQATGVRYHVAHLSTKVGVELVRVAKAMGVHVTAEVSPHHLLLDDTDIQSATQTNLKMNPPLRTPADREAVIAGLLDGTIDMVATDHAPHSVADKRGDFRTAAFGITGLETCFPLLYTHFVESGLATLGQLQQWLVKAPASAFDLDAPTVLKVGMKADLAMFDISHRHTINANEFASKAVNSPFVGQTVTGMTLITMVDGEIVYDATTDNTGGHDDNE